MAFYRAAAFAALFLFSCAGWLRAQDVTLTSRDGAVEETTVEPGDFGLEAVAFEGLVGGDARANADIIGAVLDGAAGAPRVAVVINAAAALLAAGAERDPKSARQRVEEAIDAGRARDLLARWVGA